MPHFTFARPNSEQTPRVLRVGDRVGGGPPAPLTSFVGREKEIGLLCAMLSEPEVRLLTLTGTPGIGKTRLALQVIERMQSCFLDGAHFISLATVTMPDDVIPVVARALGLREGEGGPLQKRLEGHLRDKQALLLLDNFEQVASKAPAIAALLASAPQLKVLVTSRALLRVYGEHEFRVPPLALPQPQAGGGPYDLKALSRLEAVRLFVQRARAANASFTLTRSNAEPVAELCIRLDGLPLAIELAAARAGLETPEGMLARLGSRLDYLRSGMKGVPARQQTIRSALEWSYDLLSDSQQRLFRHLAPLVGGFTMESARMMCCAAGACSGHERWDFEDDFAALVDHSLISRVERGREAGADRQELRFTVLETVREYASERLSDFGETPAAMARHARCFATLAERAKSEVGEAEQIAALDSLEREYGNFRAALSWCAGASEGGRNVGADGDTELGLRIARALVPFWQVRGSLCEGRAWLSLFLNRAEASGKPVPQKELLESLFGLGHFASSQNEHNEARAIFERALALSKEQDNNFGIGLSLSALGHAAIHLGEPDRAESYYLECLALCVKFGNKPKHVASLLNLGDLACYRGDNCRALELFTEALQQARESESKIMLAGSLNKLGYLLAETDDLGNALSMATEAMRIFQTITSRNGIAYCLGLHGKIAYAMGHLKRAATIFGATDELCRTAGLRMEPMLHKHPDEYEESVASLQKMLGEESFAAAWQKGRKMTVEQAIEMAMTPAIGRQIGKSVDRELIGTGALTSREIEVLRLVTAGQTNAQVAGNLVISPYTVNMHLRSIYSKLGVPSRSAATRYAVENKLV